METEDRVRIDELWHFTKPSSWGKGKHARERLMLHDILLRDERVKAISESTFLQPVVPLKRGLKLWGYHDDRGVAVATDRRVLFLKHRMAGGNIAVELPYKSLTAMAETGGGFLSEGVIIVRHKDGSWKITQVSPESAQVKFSDAVKQHAHSLEGTLSPF
ncbi:MAG: PH domain-containing protein [Chloroflexota bacterium]|nr:PH domain-containing protein [Chloroflexota bacterium]